jgi:hypothetical protein
MNVLMSKVIVLLMLSVVSASAGYSKLEALSLIESGNNDAAVGSLGEVSRYQIRPHIWREYSASRSWRDSRVSAQVAENHLKSLEETFMKRSGRAPTDFDSYVLWNAGAAYYAKVGFSPARVHPVIRERAQRYVNLRTVNLAQGPTTKTAPVAAVQPPKPPPAPMVPSAPAWTLAQAISAPVPAANAYALAPMMSGLSTISVMPRSVVGEHN